MERRSEVKSSAEMRMMSVAILSICIFCIWVSFPLPRAQNSYWTVSSGFPYYSSAGSGLISFGSQVKLDEWYWSGSQVRFKNLVIGSRTASEVGISCSSNGNVTIDEIDSKSFSYTVDGSSGATVTTKVYFKNRGAPKSVTGALSWTWNSVSEVITVTTYHTSSKDIKVGWSAVTEAFDTVRQLWGQVFLLIVIVLSFSVLQDPKVGILGTVISLVVGTGTLIILLKVVENLG